MDITDALMRQLAEARTNYEAETAQPKPKSRVTWAEVRHGEAGDHTRVTLYRTDAPQGRRYVPKPASAHRLWRLFDNTYGDQSIVIYRGVYWAYNYVAVDYRFKQGDQPSQA